MSENNKLLITAIISLIIGFGIAWLIFGEDTQKVSVKDGDLTQQEESTTDDSVLDSDIIIPVGEQASEISSLVVEDQAPGKVVVLKEANLNGEAWIAVREDLEGTPGNILGAKYVSESSEEVEIPLLRGTVEGGKYYVSIFQDNGDREFDHNSDLEVVSTMVSFTTSVVPNE